MLVTMKEMLRQARAGKYAVGAYDFVNSIELSGIVAAAEETGTPVILQFPDIGGEAFRYAVQCFTPMMRAVAEKAKVPCAVHLDHGKSVEACKLCADAGFSSVMIDASIEPYEVNVARTREVVEYCKPLGISVEAEIGHVGEGFDTSTNVFTDPDECARFVADTGVDCVAVSIGNAHGAYKDEPKINYDVLTAIEEKVSVPLVLHGGSGIPDEDFKKIIRHGIAKVNIFTELTLEAAAELQKLGPRLNHFQAEAAITEGFKKKTLEKIRLFETKPME